MGRTQYCEFVNADDNCVDCGRVATEAACNSLDSDAIVATCNAIGAEQTIYTMCLELGFSEDNCNDAVAVMTDSEDFMNALEAGGCDALPENLPAFCAAASLLTPTDQSCEDWGGYGYIQDTFDVDGFNAAVASLEAAELALLTGACDAVNSLIASDEACANHELGHLCENVEIALTADPDTTDPAAATLDDDESSGGGASVIIIVVVVVGALVAGAAAYYFLVASAGKTEEVE